jgi:hypothetical protein
MYIMGAHQSKLQGMYLPAQSGKTGKMNNLIFIKKQAEEYEGDVNFIISSNNLVLVEQTKQRMEAALQEVVYTWRSGKKDGEGKCEKKHSAKDLAWDILNDDVETVVMCANAARMKHLAETIRMLEECHRFTKKINIWIDEADASIQLWSKQERILSFSKVQTVTLVSATFDTIFKRYGRIYVLGFEQTHPECYRCLRDCTKVEVNVVGTPLDYVRHIVTTHGLAKPGVCAFVPGDITQSSHNAIAEYLQEHGFVVVIINGERKEILVPGGESIDLKPYISSLDELNITLAKLYHENGWNQRPFAVTGHYCIGRGVTFQCLPDAHDGFLFTHGILSPIADASTAYQIMARLFGNIGHHPRYIPCTIYSTHSMFTRVGKKESCALHLAKMIHEEGGEGAEVGAEEVKKAMNFNSNADKIDSYRIYKEEEIVRCVCKLLGYKYKPTKDNADGFKETSLNKKKSVASLQDAIQKVPAAYGMNAGEKTFRVYFPCYVDTTDKSTLRFVVIIRPDTDKSKLAECERY